MANKEKSGEFLQVEDMQIDMADLRVPWEFIHFALNHKDSSGVIGKVFLRMMGEEGVKIDAKYESDCNLFRKKFISLARLGENKRNAKKGGAKKETAAPQQQRTSAAHYPQPQPTYHPQAQQQTSSGFQRLVQPGQNLFE